MLLAALYRQGCESWHQPDHGAAPSARLASPQLSTLVLAACAETENADGGGEGEESGGSVAVGTTDVVTALDPAASYDNGSFAVQNQVYPFPMNTPYGSPDVEPDIAESAEFTAPSEYTVTLKVRADLRQRQ